MVLLDKKGLTYLHSENLDKARSYFVQGFKYSQKLKDCQVQLLRFENNIGQVEDMLGNQDKAIHIYQRTRALAKNLDIKELVKITNNDLGHVYFKIQKFDECLPYIKEDIKTFSHLKNREPLARALYTYAEALRKKEKFDKAVLAYQECINMCKRHHYYSLLLRAYSGFGSLNISLNQNTEAIENYQKAVDIAVRLKDITSKSGLLFNQAYIYGRQGNLALAQRKFLMAKQVLENKGTALLAYEEMILSKCYNELTSISSNENNPMKALGYQLERQKLVNQSSCLQSEKFSVTANLAELYLANRLKKQFLAELGKLEDSAASPREKDCIKKLKNQWKEIEDNIDQDSTGKIAVVN